MVRLCVMLVAASVAFQCSSAFAQRCYSPRGESEAIACLPIELREADRRLNDAYTKLMAEADEQSKRERTNEQREWLRRRDSYCRISSTETDRERWLQAIGTDYSQAACVTHFTRARTNELRAMRSGVAGRRDAVPVDTREGGSTAEMPARPAPAATPYPTVTSTWGAVLNRSGDVPDGEFKAFYINSQQPEVIVASETVRDVSINYPWSEFHGIKSQDFGAYWVGRFRYETDTPTTIGVSQSWSKARIMINSKLIYEGSGKARIPYTFEKGDNLVEVEYLNNWHTTEFAVDFAAAQPALRLGDLKEQFRNERYAGVKVLFVGLYESRSRDLTTELNLQPSADPVVLVLSSYSTVKWRIKNPHKVDVRAVAYGSYSPGSRLEGDLETTVERFPFEGYLNAYSTQVSCSCHGALFHCEGGKGLRETVGLIEGATGLSMIGYSGKYAAEALDVPQVRVSPDTLIVTKNLDDEIDQRRAACERQINPDFERLFDASKEASQDQRAGDARPIGGAVPAVQERGPESSDRNVLGVDAGVQRERGKWYFEVVIDSGSVANITQQETMVMLEFQSSKGQNIGKRVLVRNTEKARQMAPVVYGLALDLDNGRFYSHIDGAWSPGLPGTAEGTDVKLGRPYRAAVYSTAPGGSVFTKNAVKVNFGATPFRYPVPAGYSGFLADASSKCVSLRAEEGGLVPIPCDE